MEVPDLKRVPELLAFIEVKAFDEKRFHDALVHGFAWYLVCREVKDEEQQKGALVAIKGAAESLLPPKEQGLQCSFCGRRPPEIRLAAGPDVFICDGCVDLLTEVFSTQKS